MLIVVDSIFGMYACITTDFRDILLFYNLSQEDIQMKNERRMIGGRIDEMYASCSRGVSASRMRKRAPLHGGKAGGARRSKR